MIWAYFSALAFEKFNKLKAIVYISWYVLWLVCFPPQIMPSFGHMLSLATSPCHSVGFCIVLCIVSALNSQAIQSEACISAAEYKHLPFFLEAVLKCLGDYFPWEQNQMEKKWWGKCQSSEGTSVPVVIQTWSQHSGVFCFQIFCILPVLPLLSRVCG